MARPREGGERGGLTALCPLLAQHVRNGRPRPTVQEHAVGLAAAAGLVLPVAGDLGPVLPALHVPELAGLLEAVALLPGRAHRLRAQGCFAVPEGAVVPLHPHRDVKQCASARSLRGGRSTAEPECKERTFEITRDIHQGGSRERLLRWWSGMVFYMAHSTKFCAAFFSFS